MFQENQYNGLAGAGQQSLAQQALPKDLYTQHREAVLEYHEACRAFQQASARRAASEKQLACTTQELAGLMQQVQCDPTQPQPTEVRGNGMGAGSIPRY